MKAHADPLDVGLVVAEKLPDVAVGVGLRDLREGEDFAHHEQHDETAIRIDGEVPPLIERGCRG